MYYSGHGDEKTGGWIVQLENDKTSLNIEDCRIQIDDVLKIINESGFKGNVEISSDSCYSGKLCFSAKKFWEEKGGFDGKLSFASLKFAASTHSSRKALWGCYRNMKKDSLKEGNSEALAKEIQVVYEKRFGLTEFDTRQEKDPIKAMYAIRELLPLGCKPKREEFMERFWETVSNDDKE